MDDDVNDDGGGADDDVELGEALAIAFADQEKGAKDKKKKRRRVKDNKVVPQVKQKEDV